MATPARPLSTRAPIALAILSLAAAFSGCLSDDAEPDGGPENLFPAGSHAAYGYDVYLPPGGEPGHAWGHPEKADMPESISALELVGGPVAGASGNGIAVFGNLVFAGPNGGPVSIVDISDPYEPSVTATIDVAGRDIDTIAYPDGRLVIVSTAGSNSMYVADVTDPASPFMAATFDSEYPSHNLAVVPGTPILYNSPSSGTHTDIWDLSDPENPVLVNDWESGHGCHDIMFFNDPARDFYRAYCAGIDRTQIWDTTDPVHPVIVAEMPFPPEPNAQATISHIAMPNSDATVLVVGDEVFGACNHETLLDGTPAEFVAPKRVSLWFYDISNETAPVLHGKVSPGVQDQACTNHFGRIIDDREQLVMGFYQDGILVVDFEDIDAPYVVSQTRSAGSTWDAWYYQGFAITGGGGAGMEIYRFV